jgi:signal transduction histidine kinase
MLTIETLFKIYESPIALWMVDDLSLSKFNLKHWRGLPTDYAKSNPKIPIAPSRLGENLDYFKGPVHFMRFSSHTIDHWKVMKNMTPRPELVILVPLRGRESNYGIVELYIQRPVKLEKREIELLGGFGSQVGTIIEALRYRKAERQSGALLASEIAASAHDLGNSLEVLKSVSTKLLTFSEESSEIREQSKILVSELDFIDEIKSLVGFQTLSPLQLPMQLYSIRAMIERSRKTLENRNQLPPNGLVITGPNHPKDEAYCNRVVVVGSIRNILKNAIEAGTSRRPIEIRFDIGIDEKYWTLDIINYGTVMNLAQIQNVFEPGFTTKVRGSGFGLSSYRELLRRSGGTLVFVESSITTGTRFRLRILAKPNDEIIEPSGGQII